MILLFFSRHETGKIFYRIYIFLFFFFLFLDSSGKLFTSQVVEVHEIGFRNHMKFVSNRRNKPGITLDFLLCSIRKI